MINAAMKTYNYFTFGAEDDYGQSRLSDTVQGSIKIAIYNTSTSVQDNINYKDCNYIGLTMAPVDDSYVIEYGNEKLKVQYVQPGGRFKQVFMKQI
jgi:hypothetical protein